MAIDLKNLIVASSNLVKSYELSFIVTVRAIRGKISTFGIFAKYSCRSISEPPISGTDFFGPLDFKVLLL